MRRIGRGGLGEVWIKAPDELAGFLLQRQLEQLGGAELVCLPEEGWEVRLRASGSLALAAALEVTRAWLAKERIAATEVVVEGQTQTLTAPS